jgi:AcrR family transcriptional regulator
MEEKKKEDRRNTRTRQALHLALLELVKEKGYEGVTIEEITARANLGRTTFYLHYQDKEELLLENLEQHLTALVDGINKRSLILWFHESQDYLVKSIFATVKENSDIFSLIIREQSNKVYDRFRGIMARVATKMIAESPRAEIQTSQLPIPVDYIIDYFSGAMWASIVWWARADFVQSADAMTERFRSLFFSGVLRALGVEEPADMVKSITA